MDKILRELTPSTTYKVRYRAVYNDGEESAPTIAYSITTPAAPNPPKVDQTTIQVDSESLAEGIIVSWTEPAADPAKPAVSDYFVQITDDLDDWQKFEIATTDPKTIFTDNNHNVFFGYFAPIIYIRVFARGSNKQFEALEENEYYEYSYAVESGLRPPDIFVASVPGAYKYELSWAYLPERPDIVTAYKIYEASLTSETYSTEVATITDENDFDYSGGPLISLGGQTKRFAITALDAQNNESAPKYSNIIRIGVINVDFEAPPQRENINFSADPNSSDIVISWNNTGDASIDYLNSDLAGVQIKVVEVDGSGNQIAASRYIDIPFTFTDPLGSPGTGKTTKITGLLSNTRYACSLSTFDVLFNRTTYDSQNGVGTPAIIVTSKDNTPPPKPVPPVVSLGGDPLNPTPSDTGEAMIARVTQKSRTNDSAYSYLATTTPGEYKMPEDIDYFEVWMFDQLVSAPSRPTGASNPSNARRIGMVNAAFDGGESQARISITTVLKDQQRYFYTRGVDRSGNIGVASDVVLSNKMLVFGNVHISDLSADKITAGRIQSEVSIEVGPNSSNRIMIENDADTIGKIYSGVGTWSGSTTGFYLDSFGRFSLKDTLIFNPDAVDTENNSNPRLTIKGRIEALSGEIKGNFGVTGTLGALYVGNPPTNGNPQTPANNSIVIRSDGIVARMGGVETFLLDTDTGSVEFNGTITGARAVFDKDITNNPPGITSRIYYGAGFGLPTPTAPTVLQGYPSIEIRKQNTTSSLTGYVSLYRPFGSDQGIAFFAQDEDSTQAVLRGALEHGSSGNNFLEAGGVFRMAAYGTASGASQGRIRIESVNSRTGQEGQLYLAAPQIYLYSFKTTPYNLTTHSIDISGAAGKILAYNTNTGRMGLVDPQDAALGGGGKATVRTSPPTDAGQYAQAEIIMVV